MAYVKEIGQNSKDSHQTNPSYVITFIPQQNRDRFSVKDKTEFSGEKNPIVVISDCYQLNISHSKSSPNGSLNMSLFAGEINYATAIGPGDYVLVNLVNSEEQAVEIGRRAASVAQINKAEDGFKGVFKVQTVRKKLQVDPASGTKIYFFEITAFSFVEYNNVIYYNPVLTLFDKTGQFFLSNFNDYLNKVILEKGDNTVQKLLQVLISALIGNGRIQSKDQKLQQSPNRSYKLPKSLGSFLGIKNASQIIDISKFYYGIWNNTPADKATSVADGFNASFLNADGTPIGNRDNKNKNYKTGTTLQGTRILAAEYWNSVKVWSILQSYLNDLVNEMYTCNRIAPDGNVYPSLVVRQKPFSSSKFKAKTPHTKFLALPRWKINPNIVFSVDLGKDEASRINFVQVFTRSIASRQEVNQAAQTGLGNYEVSYDDIEYHGLKPYVATAAFDYPGQEGTKESKALVWKQLVADWVMGGHNKESGTMQIVGIQEPLTVGDNIEFDNIVYHVEQITHIMAMSGDKKVFRTNLVLSNGVSLESNESEKVYPESKFSDTKDNRINDYNNEQILPGYSDTQNSLDREENDGEEFYTEDT